MTADANFGKDCTRAWEIMPWVLQATAPREQGEWLMHHLAQCESCSAEFAQQSRLRSALALPAGAPVRVNAGVKHLLERVDAPGADTPPLRAGPGGNRLTRALAIAVMVQVIAIGILGARLWLGEASHLGTRGHPVVSGLARGIRVAPVASLTLAGWTRLLHDFDLHVIDGPDATGVYTVAPKAATAGTEHLLPALRASHEIRIAQPADGAP